MRACVRIHACMCDDGVVIIHLRSLGLVFEILKSASDDAASLLNGPLSKVIIAQEDRQVICMLDVARHESNRPHGHHNGMPGFF